MTNITVLSSQPPACDGRYSCGLYQAIDTYKTVIKVREVTMVTFAGNVANLNVLIGVYNAMLYFSSVEEAMQARNELISLMEHCQ